jgi:bifunctional non-homologous end joining protein LigD
VTWTNVKSFARQLGEELAGKFPERYLIRNSIAERSGRIFIDYLRNDATSTAVAPYSTRSRPGAPVATPLFWEEVVPDLQPKSFTIETVPQRLQTLGRDPWTGIDAVEQQLPA